MPAYAGMTKRVLAQCRALRRKKMCRRANIPQPKARTCERDEFISGAVGRFFIMDCFASLAMT